MTNQANPFQPAIDALEKDLAEIERNANSLRGTINVLRAKAGLPPLPGGTGGGGSGATGNTGESASLSIQHDTFFGKRMGTAARQFLEMRKAQGGGPAKPREIFDALKLGGFQFETKDEGVAIISLRNMLRKNTQVFQKLPNGTYGLRAWYPGAKKPKSPTAGGDESDDTTDESDSDTDDASLKAATA